MKLQRYTIALWVMLIGLLLSSAPLAANEEQSEGSVQISADDDTAKPKQKKKSKKKKKSSKQKNKPNDEETDAAGDDEDGEGAAVDEEEEAETLSAVAQALGKFKPVSGKPNMKADYYIYLYSASWCKYCNMCMPVAVKEYKKMRRSRKAELILICGDKSRKEAAAYLKNYKGKMPCIFFDDLKATKFRGLPGCGMPGFPAISITNKDGKVIKTGVGAEQVKTILADWKKLIIRDTKD